MSSSVVSIFFFPGIFICTRTSMLSADATAAVSEAALKMEPTSENTDATGLSGLLSPAAGPTPSLDFDVSSRNRCSLFKYKTDLLMTPRTEQLSITAVVTGTPLTAVMLVYCLIYIHYKDLYNTP